MENYFVLYFVPVAVIGISLFVTYIVHFHSAIGPGFVEFDATNSREIDIMNVYNKYLDNAYVYHMAIIGIGVFTALLFENAKLIIGIMVFQAIYIAITTACMVFMFVRSKVYWGL